MKAVILESYVMEEGDLDWSGVKALVPDTTSYVRTDYADIAPRIGDAELVLINKCRIDEAILAQCPNLKWVGIIATGTDNIDLEACRRHGVAVANVPGYSTYSVAQMTFSLLLAICQCAQRYDRAVKAGYCRRWSCWARPLASTATAASAARPPALQGPLAWRFWCAPARCARSTPPMGWSSWTLTPCLPAAMCSACTARPPRKPAGWSAGKPLQK